MMMAAKVDGNAPRSSLISLRPSAPEAPMAMIQGFSSPSMEGRLHTLCVRAPSDGLPSVDDAVALLRRWQIPLRLAAA